MEHDCTAMGCLQDEYWKGPGFPHPDEYGSLPDDERKRLAEASGGTFIGDGLPPMPTQGKLLAVRERDGSWWVEMGQLADYLDARADEFPEGPGPQAWRQVATRLREAKAKDEAKLQATMKAE